MPRPAKSSLDSVSRASSLSSDFPSSSSRSRPKVDARKTPTPPTSPTPTTILLFLVAFRLLNALTIRTFFQPDEFFQSLEPAWQIAFGTNQGAWMTWEWRNQLRSSLHPLLFAAVYRVAHLVALVLRVSPATRADLLIAAPKTAQAVVAAIGDFYTWKLAGRVYGKGTRECWTVLALTVASPWQWFCSTRTLSNCLETTITVVALDLWPWQWSSISQTPVRETGGNRDGLLARLRKCLSLAALACILRPTNILVWITLASVVLLRSTWDIRKTFVREVIICGSAVLAVSALADRLFYGGWAFPPLKFLYFNLAQSLAVFYGKNDWHYYVSQGLPLLLTTALPFTIVGLYRVVRSQATAGHRQTHIQDQLALICLVMPLTLSLISHKEVRFIYPLLPSLHVLTAPPLVDFFLPAVSRSSAAYTPRRLTLVFLLVVNVFVALYTTIYHASGTLNVLSYLREQHALHTEPSSSTISAGFLMPCHSTPWRSHLVHPTINSWALSCEPPVNLNDAEKAIYVDEADQFYDNPARFLRDNMLGGLRHIPRKPSYLSFYSQHARQQQLQSQKHEWPDYLVFFAHLEPTLQSLLRSSSYTECWRTFNTAWHDDWRRKGDIVVWCLDPGEQLAWRSATVNKQKQTQPLDSRTREEMDTVGRLVEGFTREAAAAINGGGGRRHRGKWNFPALPRLSSITWPWERRKRNSIYSDYFKINKWNLNLHWPVSSSWKLPWERKKDRRIPERELWS